jgi:uncharacterized protein (DUF302 family)/uncharacterized membrane protein YidH (DUF202 family)
MNEPTEPARRAALRDSLAAERTFLAWIRTGLALTGFGFVVARFVLYLQQLQPLPHAPAASHGLSLWFGIALVAAGVVVYLLSAWHHLQLTIKLREGGPVLPRPSAQGVLLALFLALVGLAMVIYLFSLRGSQNMHPTNNQETSMAPAANNGIVSIAGHHSVDATVDKLKAILQAKGIALFAVIDHSGEAAKVGLKMRPTKLLIFGSPNAGTPLMLAAPSSAIDLPLKILIWEDAQGKVWISYNSPAYLQQRHGLPTDLVQNIAGVETLAMKAGE